jgi:hypothetical protein
MAKCPICTIRKGKRKCLISNNQFICSLCCASTRKEETCSICVFYLPPQHDYDKAPAFSVSAIANNHALERYCQTIRDGFKNVGVLDIQDEIAIIELLMNKHYFHEEDVYSSNALHKAGFAAADSVIATELAEVDEDILANLLGAMRLAAKSQEEVKI